MRITFLVGNGFDIQAGLNSSYRDFGKWYCQEESNDPQIKKLKETIKDSIETNNENWADFEEALGKYTENFSLDNIQDFFNCYDDIRTKLLEYLSAETRRYAQEISEENINLFISGLANYYTELRPREKRDIEQVYPPEIDDNIEIRFISYNYTDIMDRYVNSVSKREIKTWLARGNTRRMYISTILHAHGTMNEYPIFGVNDESQIKNKELLADPHFRSIMIKSASISTIDVFWYEDAERMINNSDIICIYGMSLGITDSRWFELIMKWLQSNPQRRLIVFWHTKHPSDMLSIDLWSRNKAAVRKILTDYSDFSNEVIEQINRRIYIIENTQVLFRVKLEENKRHPLSESEILEVTG